MIRLTLLALFVSFLAAYAWRDWYRSLCGLILLIGVIEHPDFPKSLLGIQGLNLWNLLLFVVVLAWAASRSREKLVWDMPGYVQGLLIVYMSFVVIAFLRLAADMGPLYELAAYSNGPPPSLLNEFSEGIINCFKWVVPGLLLFDGCRSDERFRWGTYCVVAVYVVLAIQVIKWMPFSGLTSGGDLAARSIKILEREVGYHRVNMAMILSGGCWAVFCVRTLPKSAFLRLGAVATAGVVLLGLALTGGRMGFASWVVIAGVYGFIKWKKLLILAPAGVALVLMLVPAVQERLLEGFTEESIDTNVTIEAHQYSDSSGPDLYTVTAGRTFAWPFVVEEIANRPILGYGRDAMKRTGLTLFLFHNFGESFPHPHNAYLQWIFDNGIIGLIPVFLFYWFIGWTSLSLFRDESNKYGVVIGGVCLSLVLALLIASIGSQSFYPREGAVGMWSAIGLMLRVHVQKKYAQDAVLRAEQIEAQDERFWERRKQAVTEFDRTYSHA